MGILSGDNNLHYKDNCVGKNKSLEDFQECLRKSKIPLIQNVRMNSYKQYLSLNAYSVTDMILPYNGSIYSCARVNVCFALLSKIHSFYCQGPIGVSENTFDQI